MEDDLLKPNSELVYVFDDLGDMYKVYNIQEMVTVCEDTELISIYKATVFEHRLTLAMEELVQKGYIESRGNQMYSPEAGELGIKYLTEEITSRFGEDNQKKILSEIDMNWDKNKPVLPNKRKKKE
jgi:hypothetical protein